MGLYRFRPGGLRHSTRLFSQRTLFQETGPGSIRTPGSPTSIGRARLFLAALPYAEAGNFFEDRASALDGDLYRIHRRERRPGSIPGRFQFASIFRRRSRGGEPRRPMGLYRPGAESSSSDSSMIWPSRSPAAWPRSRSWRQEPETSTAGDVTSVSPHARSGPGAWAGRTGTSLLTPPVYLDTEKGMKGERLTPSRVDEKGGLGQESARAGLVDQALRARPPLADGDFQDRVGDEADPGRLEALRGHGIELRAAGREPAGVGELNVCWGPDPPASRNRCHRRNGRRSGPSGGEPRMSRAPSIRMKNPCSGCPA